MTIKGYFDGTAVKPLEPVNLIPNQRVFIQIPLHASPSETDNDRKERQKKALNDLFGLLTEEESVKLDESLSQHLKFKTLEV